MAKWDKKIWIALIIGLLVGMLLMSVVDNKTTGSNVFDKPDTTYNQVKLDSIKVQIGKRDTTIYKLNIKSKDDVEKSYQLSDSAAVELFKQLSLRTDTAK